MESFPLGRTVPSTDTAFQCLLARGWSWIEPWGVWSDGAAPELFLNLASPPVRDLILTVSADAFPAEGQGVTVVVGRRPLTHWSLKGAQVDYKVRIPRELVQPPTLRVMLKVDRPISPQALEGSADTRALGVGLRSVRLDEAP
jgi:hypothetical protein